MTLLLSICRVTILISHTLWTSADSGFKELVKEKRKPQLVKLFDIAWCAWLCLFGMILFSGYWCKFFWIDCHLSIQPQQSVWIFVLLFWYQRNCNFMETAPPNMALVCVTSASVINSQKKKIISAEPTLCTLSVTLPSDTSMMKLLPPDVRGRCLQYS